MSLVVETVLYRVSLSAILGVILGFQGIIHELDW